MANLSMIPWFHHTQTVDASAERRAADAQVDAPKQLAWRRNLISGSTILLYEIQWYHVSRRQTLHIIMECAMISMTLPAAHFGEEHIYRLTILNNRVHQVQISRAFEDLNK